MATARTREGLLGNLPSGQHPLSPQQARDRGRDTLQRPVRASSSVLTEANQQGIVDHGSLAYKEVVWGFGFYVGMSNANTVRITSRRGSDGLPKVQRKRVAASFLGPCFRSGWLVRECSIVWRTPERSLLRLNIKTAVLVSPQLR